MATKLISGVLREVWQSSAPLDGGAAEAITTGIACSAAKLSQVQASVTLRQIVNAPSFADPVLSISPTGKLVVTLTNTAGAGNTATWLLDVTLNHSVQQVRGTAPAPIPLLMSAETQSREPVATWPLDKVRHYAIDPTDGNDTNVGYVDAALNAVSVNLTGKCVKTLARLLAIIPQVGAGRCIVVHFAQESYTLGTSYGIVDLTALNGYRYRCIRAWSKYLVGATTVFSSDDIGQNGYKIAIPGPNPDGSWTVDTASDATHPLDLTVLGDGSPLAAGAARAFRARFSGNVTATLTNARCGIYESSVGALEMSTVPYTITYGGGVVPAAGDTFWIERPGVPLDGYFEGGGAAIPMQGSTHFPQASVFVMGFAFAGTTTGSSRIGSSDYVTYVGCETVSTNDNTLVVWGYGARISFSGFSLKPDGSFVASFSGARFAGGVSFTNCEYVDWGDEFGCVKGPGAEKNHGNVIFASCKKIVGYGGVFAGGLTINSENVRIGSNSDDEAYSRFLRVERVLELTNTQSAFSTSYVYGVNLNDAVLKFGDAQIPRPGSNVYLGAITGGPIAGHCIVDYGIYCRAVSLANIVVNALCVATGPSGDIRLMDGSSLTYATLATKDWFDLTGTHWVGPAGATQLASV
jgi:hypothetical protein